MKKLDYRNQALKILPWVCAKCGRDFSGKKLRELTVHHKDHNYKNNPPDGSNWELLCLYCHDNEHSRFWMPNGCQRIMQITRKQQQYPRLLLQTSINCYLARKIANQKNKYNKPGRAQENCLTLAFSA